MSVTLTFLGAAQNVTGSRTLLETGNARLLVDCGLYQERELQDRNWEPFPVSPKSIDAILLTHAHGDHCSYIPRLVKDGFRGKIYCTAATAEIAKVLLLDSAHLQEEDAYFKQKRHEKEFGRKDRKKIEPLYTEKDARASFKMFKPTDYDTPREIEEGVEITFGIAGHILGASNITVRVKTPSGDRTILFSGDVGVRGSPMLRDPSTAWEADYVVMETTYGDRLHEDPGSINDRFADVINSTKAAGGNLVIPCFAIERSHEILYRLNQLLLENRIPHLPIFLDSPMAIKVTAIYERFAELFDHEMRSLIEREESPFHFAGLKMLQTINESKMINHIKGSCIILAGSGMCTGGRVKHHLVHNISRPESTVLFVGYQAKGTLGRQILEGAPEVRIQGFSHRVKASIKRLQGLSSHADRNQLYDWISRLHRPPKRVFLTHGEPESIKSFEKFLNEKTGWDVHGVSYQESIELT